MAKVEISNETLNALNLHLKKYGGPKNSQQLLEELASIGLSIRERDITGIDGLTSCLTRQKFSTELNLEMLAGDMYADGQSLYEENFLCCDIDNFMEFLDFHGHAPSDQVLIDVANKFRDKYGLKNVYRFGGDEFIIRLQNRAPWIPTVIEPITIKFAIVEVSIIRYRKRHHHLREWIEHHLQRAILTATPEGIVVPCETPSWIVSLLSKTPD